MLDNDQISAEMLLNIQYPELKEKWIVEMMGSFYRNYNRDAMKVDPENNMVSLSRDGFIKVLPAAMLSDEDDMDKEDFKESIQKSHRRIQLLNAAFRPFDTVSFRNSLALESQVSSAMEKSVESLLKMFFGIDLENERNEYVRKVAPMVLFCGEWKGNLEFVRSVLERTLGSRVEMIKGRYSDDGSDRRWVPSVRYNVIRDGLSSDEYRELSREWGVLFAFVREWFLPCSMRCFFAIKSRRSRKGDKMLLNYNIETR